MPAAGAVASCVRPGSVSARGGLARNNGQPGRRCRSLGLHPGNPRPNFYALTNTHGPTRRLYRGAAPDPGPWALSSPYVITLPFCERQPSVGSARKGPLQGSARQSGFGYREGIATPSWLRWNGASSFSWGISAVAGNVCFVGGVTPIRRSGAVQLGAIPCGSLASEPVLLVRPRDYDESSARRDHQASAAVIALSASWMPSPTSPAVAAQCRGIRARAPGSHRCSSRVSGAGAVLS